MLRAGYPNVGFLLTDVVEVRLPLLGHLLGRRDTTLLVRLATAKAGCGARSSAPFRLAFSTASHVADLVDPLLATRRSGSVPCLVVNAADVSGDWQIIENAEARTPVDAFRLHAGNQEYDVVVVEPGRRVQVRTHDASGKRLTGVAELEQTLQGEGERLLMAMNGGMFHRDFRPVGLLIHEGRELSPVNLSRGKGNFFLLPNGFFAVHDQRPPNERTFSVNKSIDPAELFWPLPLEATQSGPLLLARGVEHPAFLPDSDSRAIRNGVGVDANGFAVFVISNTRVTFHELARLFLLLGCANALYLDGNVSTLYLPALGRIGKGGELGPMIAVTEPLGRL